MAIKVDLTGRDQLSRKVGGITKSFKTLTKTIKGLAFGFGNVDRIIRTALIGGSIKLAATMEKGLAEISTLMGAVTDQEIKRMGQELQNLAAISGQTMDKLAKAKYDVISAGFGGITQSALIMESAVNLALGGVSDIAAAGDLLTTTMNAYSLSAEEAEKVSDKLFTTVVLGKTTISEMGGSLGRVVGIAGSLGVNMNELLGVFATLTTSMGDSNRATTATLGALNGLLTPTAQLVGIVEDLGFKNAFAMLQQRGFVGSMKEITDEAERQRIPLTDVFSSVEALAGILPLAGKQAGTLTKNIATLGDSAGKLKPAVDKMVSTFSVSLSKLSENVKNIMRTVGTKMIEGLQPHVDKANEILMEFGAIGWDNVGTAIATNVGAIMGRVIDMLKIVGEIIKIVITDAFLPDASAIKKAWFETAGFLADVIPGLDKLYGASGDELRSLADKSNDTALQIEALAKKLQNEMAKALEFMRVESQKAKDANDDLNDSLDGTGDAGDNASGGIDKVTDSIEELKKALTIGDRIEKFITDVEIGFEKLAEKMGVSTNQLKSGIADSMNALVSITESGLEIQQAKIDKGMQNELAVVEKNFDNKQEILDASLEAGTLTRQQHAEQEMALEEQKQAQINAIEEQARIKSEAVAKKARKIKIATAISETALAVLKSFRNAGGWPLGVIPAGLTAAAGAVQVQAIKAQPFARGGIVTSNGTDSVLGVLNEDEFLSNKQAADRFGAELADMNAAAETGGQPRLGGGNTYNIYALDSRTFEQWARQNPRGFAGGVNNAVTNRSLVMTAQPDGKITTGTN